MIDKLRETMEMLACIEQNLMDLTDIAETEICHVVDSFNATLEDQKHLIRVGWRNSGD